MSQVQIGDRTFDQDPRRWDEDNRRDASLVVGGLAAFFLLAAILFYGLAPSASGWFLWASIVVLVLLLIAEAVVLATGIAREENVGPHWLSEPEAHRGQAAGTAGAATATQAEQEPDEVPEPPSPPEIDLECPECREMFTVEDTGERPLHTECPHCGAAGHVNLDNLPEEHDHEHDHDHDHGAEAAAAGVGAEPEPEHEEISLECPACGTQFDVEDDGTRPLTATCPGCGSSGKLKG